MIGSGWIGMELAAAASTYGNDVTLLGLEEVPLGGAIGPDLGRFFRSPARGQRRAVPAAGVGRGRSRGTEAASPACSPIRASPAGRRRGHCRGRGSRHRPGPGGRPRDPATASSPTRRCGPAPGYFRRGRRRQRPAPVHRRAPPQRALVQRPERRQGGGQGDARPGRHAGAPFRTSTRTSSTSAWSTQASPHSRPGCTGHPRLAGGQGVHRLLAAGRPGGGRA